MILGFLRMRSRQFLRMYRSLGLIYMLLLFFFALLVLYVLDSIRFDQQACLSVLGITATILILIHFNRKDLAFIRKLDVRPSGLILLEYALITLPVWIMILFGSNWYYSILFLSFLIPLSLYFPKKSRTIHAFMPRNFYWLGYEFRSGIRRNILGILILLLLAISSFFEPYLVLGYNFLLLVLLATVYQQCESREVLEAGELPTKLFLRKKIGSLMVVWFLSIIPINLLVLFLFSPNPYLILFSILISLVISVYFLMAKYAYFTPNEDLSSQSATTSLVLLGYFIPIFSLMTLVLILINIPKARSRLNSYLHDFD